ncbi:hypothetical protein D3C72_1275460 [compost metagenome]
MVGQRGVGRHGVQPALRAQPAVPVIADGHVPHFVTQDDVDDRGGGLVAGLGQLGPHWRRGVQPACLERARHQRHAREHIAGGLVAHLPQAVVRREVAVLGAQRGQMVGQQREMQGLLARHLEPVAIEARRHAGKAPRGVQREVDRVEFDMAQRMNHRRPPRRGAQRAAALHLLGRHQFRARGPAGQSHAGSGGECRIRIANALPGRFCGHHGLEQRPGCIGLRPGIGHA